MILPELSPNQHLADLIVGIAKHNLTYIMRTIPNISHQLEKTDDLILTKFIPAITGGIYVNPVEH